MKSQSFCVEGTSHEDRFCVALVTAGSLASCSVLGKKCMLRKDVFKERKHVLYSRQVLFDSNNPYLAGPITS